MRVLGKGCGGVKCGGDPKLQSQTIKQNETLQRTDLSPSQHLSPNLRAGPNPGWSPEDLRHCLAHIRVSGNEDQALESVLFSLVYILKLLR